MADLDDGANALATIAAEFEAAINTVAATVGELAYMHLLTLRFQAGKLEVVIKWAKAGWKQALRDLRRSGYIFGVSAPVQVEQALLDASRNAIAAHRTARRRIMLA